MHEKGLRLVVVRGFGQCAMLVLAVAYFVMVWIGKSERREVLRTHIVESSFEKWSAKLELKKVLLKPSPKRPVICAFFPGG